MKSWFVRADGSSIRDLASATPAKEFDWRDKVTPAMHEQYARDGVLHIPQLLHPEWLALIEQGMRRNVNNPGYNSMIMHEGDGGEYIMDFDNFHVNPEYQYLLHHSYLADVMQYLMSTKEVWLFSDQIFVKRGGNNKPTFWHQDLPHFIIEGNQIGSTWITLDPLPKEFCLEFVPGSHLGTQYAGSTFNAKDPTEPYYPTLPRLPDIEKDRHKFQIVSWEIVPGDVIIIHPGVLHGGGATGPAAPQRRTITIRFYGDDAVLNGRFERDKQLSSPYYPAVNLRVKPGEPMRDPRFPKLRPLDANASIGLKTV